MKEDTNTKKTLINESPKDQEDPLKSETLFLKQPKESILNKDIIQIKSQENNQTQNNISKSNDISQSSYYILVSYCFMIFASGYQLLSFNTLPFFSSYYEITNWKLDFFALIYVIEYIILFVPEMILIEKLTTKNLFRISALCILVGSAIKVIIKEDKSLVASYIGQIISGLSRPYLLMISGKLTADWFKENIRNFICTICVLSDIGGILIGYIWNLAYIKKEENDIKVYKDHIYRYFLAEFILVFILCIPALFLDESEPDKPSSPSRTKEFIKFNKESIKKLFSNVKYILILISMFFIGGYYYIISMKFANFVAIYSLDKKKSDLVYSISITVGVVSSLIISYILDKYKKYKMCLIIISLFSTVCQIFLTFLLELVKSKDLNAYAICLLFYIFINANIIIFYSNVINYICEITYPIAEYISIGFIIAMTQIYNLCGHFLYKYILENNDKKYICNVLFTIFFGVSSACCLFYENKLERYEIDKKEENINLNEGKVIPLKK